MECFCEIKNCGEASTVAIVHTESGKSVSLCSKHKDLKIEWVKQSDIGESGDNQWKA